MELGRTLAPRIVEFHLKDVKPEHRGGARQRLDHPDMMKDVPFLPLGAGGVDHPALKGHVDKIAWGGARTDRAAGGGPPECC